LKNGDNCSYAPPEKKFLATPLTARVSVDGGPGELSLLGTHYIDILSMYEL